MKILITKIIDTLISQLKSKRNTFSYILDNNLVDNKYYIINTSSELNGMVGVVLEILISLGVKNSKHFELFLNECFMVDGNNRDIIRCFENNGNCVEFVEYCVKIIDDITETLIMLKEEIKDDGSENN